MSISYRRALSFKADQKGQALTELALAAPLLLFVMVAVVSLASAGQKKAQVERAAAAAARVAVVRPDLAAKEALETLKAGDDRIKATDVKTTVEAASIAHLPFSNPVRVKVILKYRPVTGFGWHPLFVLKSEYIIDRWVNGVWF